MTCWNVFFSIDGEERNVFSVWSQHDATFAASPPLGDQGSCGEVRPCSGDLSLEQREMVSQASSAVHVLRTAVRYLQPNEVLVLTDLLGRFPSSVPASSR